jgi:predicted metal-dependent phosphoesterase TrpH
MSAEKDSAQPAAAVVTTVVATAISVPPPGVLDTMVRVIMGQTEMTHEEVVSALERTNYDLKRVIREYMTDGQDATATSTLSSTNQLRFSEIRGFMDKSDLMYYQRKEMTRIYNEVLERKKAAAEAAAAAVAAAAAAVAETGETTVETTVESPVSKL